MSEHPTAGEHPPTSPAHQDTYLHAEQPAEKDRFEHAPYEEAPQTGKTIAWDTILFWSILVAAVVIVGVLTVFLVLGLLELIAVVSPVLMAILLIWVGYLTFRLGRLEKNVGIRTR